MAKFEVRAAGCVTLFWLVGSEVTGRCFREPSSQPEVNHPPPGGGSLSSYGKIKGIVTSVSPEEEPGPCPTVALLLNFFKKFFLCGPFLVFIEFVTILLLVYVLVFWPLGMWDLSTPTRDQIWTPCIGSWSPNHWTIRHYCFLTAVPLLPFSD